jgi:translation initiation factor 1
MNFLPSTKCDEAFDEIEVYQVKIVNIWLKQRTSRKYYTEIDGLADDLDLDKILKCWRHEFHCSAAKTLNKNEDRIIRLQGDQRNLVLAFLLDEKIIGREHIKIHGF